MTGNGRCAIRVLAACILVLFLLTHPAIGAHAACTNPDRAIGKVVYSEDNNLFQGCTARGWMVLHHGVTASSGGGPLTQVGTMTSPDLERTQNIVVSGNYAYLTSHIGNSLTIVDVSNPAAPVQVGALTTPELDGAYGIAVAGNYAYVASFDSDSLTIIDVSNPAAPVQVGALITPELDRAQNIAVAGSYAYVATSSGVTRLVVIDISNPAAPTQAGTFSGPEIAGARGIAVSGTYVYVAAAGADSLTIIDVSNPAAPVLAGTRTNPVLDGAWGIAVAGDFAYVSALNAGTFNVIDVSNPANPVLIGLVIDPPFFSYVTSIVVAGNYAYVGSFNNDSLVIVDISNPVAPVQLDTISTAALDGARDVAVSGNHAYVAAANVNSLTVIDLGVSDCRGPDRPSGGIVFNADHDVFQGCAGGQWVAFHGAGTPGGATDCTAPAKPVGALFFNEDYDVFQGCTTRGWKAFHAVGTPPPVLCTNAGDVCADGSYYIGQIGGNDIYATAGASESNQTWNNGTMNWTVTGFTSRTDGLGNTAGLVALADAGAPYDAAEYCDGLSAHGHGDWYLPARDELNALYINQTAIGGFAANFYWSSTESASNNAWEQNFSNGFQGSFHKITSSGVRCVRRNDATPDAFSFEGEVDVAISTLIESDIIEISGMDDGTAVSITGDGSPEYRICADVTCSAVNHDWTSGAGSIDAGEYLQLRLTSHAAGGAMHSATVTVGTENDQWDVTTEAADCPNIGDLCSDGSVYAGDNIYVTDVNQSTSIQWSTETVDTGADSNHDGAANQAWIVANETLSEYPAFELCEDLNRHGHTDWYLPARNELNLLYTRRNAIGGFTASNYWSSTENTNGTAWRQRFSDGLQVDFTKTLNFGVRCVRRTAPGP